MSQADALTQAADDWQRPSDALAADPRFPTEQQLQALQSHSDALTQRTRAVHGGELPDTADDFTPRQTLRALLIFIVVVHLTLCLAAVGVSAGLYLAWSQR